MLDENEFGIFDRAFNNVCNIAELLASLIAMNKDNDNIMHYKATTTYISNTLADDWQELAGICGSLSATCLSMAKNNGEIQGNHTVHRQDALLLNNSIIVT